ncbi:MAG: tetratricopeptide repeat protein [Elusimicrobia bacterium]|nr:tetratricopeptide repeat protein [Elusimicrobiota bacterium]
MVHHLLLLAAKKTFSLAFPFFLLARFAFAAGDWWDYHAAAQRYEKKGMYEEAINNYINAICLDGKDRKSARTYGMHFMDYFPHRDLGMLYYKLGLYQKAVLEFKKSLENIETEPARQYLKLAQQQVPAGVASQELELERKKAQEEAAARKFYEKADDYFQNKKWELAVSESRKALELFPAFTQANDLLEKAGEQLALIEEKEEAERLWQEAERLFKQGQYASAADQCERVLTLAPGRRQAQTLLEKAKQAAERLEEKAKAAQIKERAARLYNEAKQAYKKGRYALAKGQCETILSFAPAHREAAQLLDNIQQTLSQRENEQNALRHYENGQIYARQGDMAKAIAAWNQALELVPKFRDTLPLLKLAEHKLEAHKEVERKLALLKLKERLAILDFEPIGVDKVLAEAVSENFRTMMSEKGQFYILERKFIAKILEEQKLQISGAVDPEQVVKLGKLAAAKSLLLGSLTKIGTIYTLNARIVDVESGKVGAAFSAETKKEDELPAMMEKVIKALSG